MNFYALFNPQKLLASVVPKITCLYYNNMCIKVMGALGIIKEYFTTTSPNQQGQSDLIARAR